VAAYPGVAGAVWRRRVVLTAIGTAWTLALTKLAIIAATAGTAWIVAAASAAGIIR
jgi:hypothetical protein